MKKVIISGERRAEVVHVPDPVAKADWAVVKIATAPMCPEYKKQITHPKLRQTFLLSTCLICCQHLFWLRSTEYEPDNRLPLFLRMVQIWAIVPHCF